jgi:hypothetical protein
VHGGSRLQAPSKCAVLTDDAVDLRALVKHSMLHDSALFHGLQVRKFCDTSNPNATRTVFVCNNRTGIDAGITQGECASICSQPDIINLLASMKSAITPCIGNTDCTSAVLTGHTCQTGQNVKGCAKYACNSEEGRVSSDISTHSHAAYFSWVLGTGPLSLQCNALNTHKGVNCALNI